MTQIDLYDDLYIEFAKKGISISCDHPDVPNDESNIAYKAADLFLNCLKKNEIKETNGLSIKIIKKIPPGGGLGGGSSNAASVLTALNNYHKNPFSKSWQTWFLF